MEMLVLKHEYMQHEMTKMKQENEVLLQQNARLSNEIERKNHALKQRDVKVRIMPNHQLSYLKRSPFYAIMGIVELNELHTCLQFKIHHIQNFSVCHARKRRKTG